jgi:sugar phosphate isomerase/epimerase
MFISILKTNCLIKIDNVLDICHMWHPRGTTQLDYNVTDVTKINHVHMND